MYKGEYLMRKIIQFIRGISDGGAETLVKDYATLLDKDNFSTTVVTLFERKNSANSRILRENHINVICIYPYWNFFVKVFNKLFGEWYVSYCIKKIIEKENPIAIHAHMNVLKYLRPIHKKIKGTNLLYTCHTLPQRTFGKGQIKEYDAAKFLIANNNLQVIALHTQMAAELNELFSINNTKVIHNAIDFAKFRNVSNTKKEVRKSIGIPEEAFVIGHVGRFHIVKNHRFLLEIFSVVKQNNKNGFLLLIGDGEELVQIKKQIKEKRLDNSVLILSNRTDVHVLMRAMDVFVFPSLLEGLGIVMIEAQLSGLRCIASSEVPKEAFITDLAIPLSLDLPAKKWCEVILDNSIKGPYKGSLEDYDMSKEIKKLESLYTEVY